MFGWKRLARRLPGWTVAALALAAAAGCGKGTYPVQGKVIFKDGSPIDPLVGGQVVFEPVDKTAKHGSRGEIQPGGSFHLGTFKNDDGAFPGDYRALVIPPPPPPRKDEKRRPKPVIDPRYESLKDSPLKFTVTQGSNEFTVTVAKP
jgi:hypothetical protein